MPQLMPLYWMLSFLMFLLIMIMMIMVYFKFNNYLNNSLSYVNNNGELKLEWLW